MAAAVQLATEAGAEPREAEVEPCPKRRRLEEEEEQETRASSSSCSEASDPSSVADPEPLVGPKPLKAYRNPGFLNSHEARLIRVMCEMEEPGARLDAQGIENIVMFFGSARAKPRGEYEAALGQAEAAAEASPEDAKAQAALARLGKQAFLIPIFDAVRDLARMLTEWSMERARAGRPQYHVGTGGGPGMMTAANHGAALAG